MKEKTDDKSDIRRYPRVRAEHLIAVRPLSSSGKNETLTTAKVVGMGGLMFESEKRMRAGRRLELTILAGTELLKTVVRVAWCRKSDGSQWQVGVEFLDISEENQMKLLDFLMRRVYLEEEIGE